MNLFLGCEGPPDAEIIFVGEAWGEEERRQELPFQGKAGHCLDRHLAQVPLARSKVRLTNLVKEQPPQNDISGWFAKLKKKEYEEFYSLGRLVFAAPKGWEKDGYDYWGLTAKGMDARKLLLEELSHYTNARCIVALGGSAAFALTGRAPILSVRGFPFHSERLPVVLPTVHPSFIMRGQYLQGCNLVQDIRKALDIAKPGFRFPVRELQPTPDLSEALYHLERLRRSSLVASDIEEVGDKIACISFSDRPDWAISIPLMGHFGPDEPRVLQAIAAFYADPGPAKLFQNAMFDIYELETKLHLRVEGRVEDTMILQQIGYPEFGEIRGNGLDALAARYTFEPYWKGDGKAARRVGSFEKLREYNCKDSSVDLEVWGEQAHIRVDETYLRMYNETMTYLRPSLEMMKRGLPVDQAAWEANLRGIAERIIPLETELERLAGWPVNANSGPDVRKLFYDQLGIKPFTTSVKNKDGSRRSKITVDEEALGRMAAGTAGRKPIPEAGLVLDVRRLVKDRGFYQTQKKGYPPTDKRAADGKYRTSIRLRGTVSGRFSMSEAFDGSGGPHNILPQEFREVVIPSPGHFFWAIDKAKAEWAAVALECGDPAMLQCLRENRDPYAWTAHLATGLPYDLILEEHKQGSSLARPEEFQRLRQQWPEFATARNIMDIWTVRAMYKEACLAFNYLMSAERFSLENRIPLPQAKTIRLAYLRAYPGIPRWWSDVEYRLRTTKTVISTVGHKIRFVKPFDTDLHKAGVNYSPQNSVNWLTKQGLLFAHENPRLIPLIERHDEIFGEYPLADLPLAMQDFRDLAEAMSQPLQKDGRSLVIENELKVGGTNWRSMHELPLSSSTLELRTALGNINGGGHA